MKRLESKSWQQAARTLNRVLAGLCLMGMTACVQPTADHQTLPAPATDPQTPATPQPAPNRQEAVTFYKDILPLFRLNEPRRQYECIQCHLSYADPAKVVKASVVDDIIKSVESGFMPANEGDRMWPQDIELLKLWRRSGMQIGTPPTPASTGNPGVRP